MGKKKSGSALERNRRENAFLLRGLHPVAQETARRKKKKARDRRRERKSRGVCPPL
jgi:hypothetical protein